MVTGLMVVDVVFTESSYSVARYRGPRAWCVEERLFISIASEIRPAGAIVLLCARWIPAATRWCMIGAIPSSEDEGSDLFWCWIRRMFPVATLCCWSLRRICSCRCWTDGVNDNWRLWLVEAGDEADDAKFVCVLELGNRKCEKEIWPREDLFEVLFLGFIRKWLSNKSLHLFLGVYELKDFTSFSYRQSRTSPNPPKPTFFQF